jgi:hypothetical protein
MKKCGPRLCRTLGRRLGCAGRQIPRCRIGDDRRDAPARHRNRTRPLSARGSHKTRRWRKVDSNPRSPVRKIYANTEVASAREQRGAQIGGRMAKMPIWHRWVINAADQVILRPVLRNQSALEPAALRCINCRRARTEPPGPTLLPPTARLARPPDQRRARANGRRGRRSARYSRRGRPHRSERVSADPRGRPRHIID